MKRLLVRRTVGGGLVTTLGTVALLALAGGSALAQGVFVNEVHYDNAGLDEQEGIEVAGPAGVDLSAYSLDLYNGYDGARYASFALSGALPDQQNGYGTRFFPAPVLQNGAPDGLALLGPAGVEGLLGYEGTFVATDGRAVGLSLNDIGRFEPPSTPLGVSLQLQGTGTSSADFAWSEPLGATRGQVNTGQAFFPPNGMPPQPVADHVRPRLSAFAISPRRFIAANSGRAVSATVGGRVVYRLSEKATTTFTVERATRGHKRGKRCINQGAGKACTRYVKRKGGFTHSGEAGVNTFRFMGRLRRRSLAPGRYRLVAVATDAANNRSARVKRKFRIVK